VYLKGRSVLINYYDHISILTCAVYAISLHLFIFQSTHDKRKMRTTYTLCKKKDVSFFLKANQTENQPVILKKKTTLKLGTITTNNNTIDQYECTTPLELDSNNKRLDLNINTVVQLNSTP